MAHSHIIKAVSPESAAWRALRAYLDSEESKVARWLVAHWKTMSADMSAEEIESIIMRGWVSDDIVERWGIGYSKLVVERLAPAWRKAADMAVRAREATIEGFIFAPAQDAIRAFIETRGANLVTNIVVEQRDALRSILSQAASGQMGRSDMEQHIRNVVGLTKPQMDANMRQWQRIYDNAIDAGATPETAAKRANKAAEKYAKEQHRYRAQMIARTELATAYNFGAYAATKDAQSKGYIGDVVKRWSTADDERVCPLCSALDGETVGMDELFDDAVLIPPRHPQCRCGCAYEEITTPTMGGIAQ